MQGLPKQGFFIAFGFYYIKAFKEASKPTGIDLDTSIVLALLTTQRSNAYDFGVVVYYYEEPKTMRAGRRIPAINEIRKIVNKRNFPNSECFTAYSN